MDKNTMNWISQSATHSWITMEMAKCDPQDYSTNTCIFCFYHIDPEHPVGSHSEKCAWYVAKEFIDGKDALERPQPKIQMWSAP